MKLKTSAIAVTSTIASILVSVSLASPASAEVSGPIWEHAPRSWPNVRVQNDAGPSWPVAAAVQAWGSGLHNQACGSSNQCVKVVLKNLGKTDTIAYTTQVWNEGADKKLYFAPLQIVINSAYSSMDYKKRVQVLTHELGHALGLAHTTEANVMNNDGVSDYPWIKWANRRDLFTMYRL